MYKDIIRYELAEGVSQEQLLKVASEIIDGWMKNLNGFVKWEIHSNKEGGYTDIVIWNSEEDAKAAEKEMYNIPNAGDWFACYKEGSISSIAVTSVKEF